MSCLPGRFLTTGPWGARDLADSMLHCISGPRLDPAGPCVKDAMDLTRDTWVLLKDRRHLPEFRNWKFPLENQTSPLDTWLRPGGDPSLPRPACVGDPLLSALWLSFSVLPQEISSQSQLSSQEA